MLKTLSADSALAWPWASALTFLSPNFLSANGNDKMASTLSAIMRSCDLLHTNVQKAGHKKSVC